jgi:hypothetical protein
MGLATIYQINADISIARPESTLLDPMPQLPQIETWNLSNLRQKTSSMPKWSKMRSINTYNFYSEPLPKSVPCFGPVTTIANFSCNGNPFPFCDLR